MQQTAYLAAHGFVDELVSELGEHGPVEALRDRLVLASGPPRPAAWAQNVWFDPAFFPVASIGEAVKALKAIQRNWTLYSVDEHRRAHLIEEQLPKVSAKPLVFGAPAPSAPLGSWTLWDRHTLLAAPACASPFPNGEIRFVEDKQGPPNRAYLKLWEIFTRLGQWPGPGETCLDLGSSPGGWTWVLQGLGAKVLSVDKAPLDPAVAGLPGVVFEKGSAFAVDPREAGPIDWLFCDMACYPERLLTMIERWLAMGECARFVCTLKFQGATDHAVASRFAAVPGSRLMHLFHNKHELTWIKLP